ncbi:MAG TPA: carboxypeptidase regulatory-like domain-containing protein [Terriglobales bacterium]|jgi:hypothetical protein|nr:carboxypeptidase regulatory-like domain-containing protein [Terriglobales bacterium]
MATLTRIVTILLVMVCLLVPAYAALTGDIEGTVYDPSGAVLANAKIVIVNTTTGTTRSVTTNHDGEFAVLQLEIGEYKVTVESAGLSTLAQTAEVRSGEKTFLRVKMEVKKTEETITVEGQEPKLDIATAQVSESIDQATALTLPNQGRNPVALATLAPGIVPVTNDNPFLGTGSFNSNGSRGRANNITIDNTTSTDISTTGNAELGTFVIDEIQEFKLITNNFDAEYGRNAGAQVQIITRSGGNAYHGTLYEYHQNAAFNARDFFDTTGKPTPFIQNNWGFVAGGPIIKNHTFIFGHYDGVKTRGAGSTSQATVLTPAQAGAITDPTAAGLFAAVGSPDSPIGTLSSSASNKTDTVSWAIRVDQLLRGGKDTLAVRYGENPTTQTSPGNIFIQTHLPNFGASSTNLSRQVTVNYTSPFGTALVNQFHFSFGRSKPNFPFLTTLTPPFAPQITISGFDSLGVRSLLPQGRLQNTFQYGDTLSWTRGRHNFKFGGDIFRYQAYSFFDSNLRGTVTFGGLAAFQSGTPTAWTENFGNTHRHNFALDDFWFAQDDYRVTDTLTLNLGFRLESSGGVSEENGIISNLNRTSTTPLGGGGTGPLGSIVLGGTAFHRNWNPAPRVGFAWNPGGGKLVIRGGYGIAYDFIYLNPITNLRFAAPFVPSITVQNFTGGNTLAALVAGTAPAQLNAEAAIGQFLSTQQNFGAIAPVDRNLKNPRNQQFDFGLEYQAMRDLVLKATYIHTKSDFLQASLQIDPVIASVIPATSDADEAARFGSLRSVFLNETGAAPVGSPLNNRLDPRFNSVTQVLGVASSNYNALQFEAVKTYRSGLRFDASYTWAHGIDNVSDALNVLVNDSPTVQDPRNLALNRGNSEFDIRQRFVLSAVYELPFAKGTTGLINKFADGWGLSGIVESRTGLPATIFSGSRRGISDVLLIGNSNAVANGNVRAFRPVGLTQVDTIPAPCARGVNTSSTNVAGVATVLCPNTAGFPLTQPLLGNAGNSGRNDVPLAGYNDTDFAVFKNTSILEGKTLQFRWEFFNIFNHPNPSGFVNTLTSATFGTYQSTANNMRQMQGVIKFVF